MHIGFSEGLIDTGRFDVLFSETWHRRLRLLIGKNHPLAGRNSVTLEELRGETAIIQAHTANKRNPVEEFCIQNGINITIWINHINKDLLTELCETGKYIGFVVSPLPNNKQLRSIPIENTEISGEFYLISNKRVFINSATETFIAWTREQCTATINNPPKTQRSGAHSAVPPDRRTAAVSDGLIAFHMGD
jgi:DNA-binding transcriptional LysR family regulator